MRVVTKVFCTSSKYSNSFPKMISTLFLNIKLVFKTVFQSISVYKPLPHSYEKILSLIHI